jgi:hypothetical protein
MHDLRQAIIDMVNRADPIKMSDKTIAYCIGKYDMLHLISEFNIHFIEPEDTQLDIGGYNKYEIHIDSDDIIELNR